MILARKLMPRSLFARSVALLAGGTALGQGLVMLTSPLLTRLYSPEDFGGYAVYTAILAIVLGVVSLRYEVAIPLPETEQGAADTAALCLLLTGATSGLTALGVWLLGPRIALWTGTPGLTAYLWLLPLSVALAGAGQAAQYWSVRNQAFPRVARAGLTESGTQTAAHLGLGWLGAGAPGLVAGRLLAQAAAATTLAAPLARRLRLASAKGIRAAAVRYRRFPLLACGAYLLNSLGQQLAPLLLASLYGAQVAGWFALGQRMIGAPMTVIGHAIAQVYRGEISRLVREEPGKIPGLFTATARRLLLLGAGPVLLLGAAGPWLFGLIFGPAWQEAGAYTRILTVMVLIQFVVVPLSYTLDALERQDLQLAWDTGRLLLLFGALALAAWRGLPADTAVMLYGGAMTISYAALFGVSWLAIRKHRSIRRGQGT